MRGRPGRRFVVAALEPDARAVELPPTVAHRVRHVMRVKEGESVELLDGAGGAIEGELVLEDGILVVKTRGFTQFERRPGELRLGVPMLKSGNTELAVQKATELGATHLVVYEAERSVRRTAGMDRDRLLERLSRVAMEAVEQCGGYHLPTVRLCGDVMAAAEQLGPGLLIPSTGPGLAALGDELFREAAAVAAIIGPEGGFTAEEIDGLERSGGIQVSLGSRVLRAETAVMMVAALAASHLGWLASAEGRSGG